MNWAKAPAGRANTGVHPSATKSSQICRKRRWESQRPGVKYLERAVNDGVVGSPQTEIEMLEAKEAWRVYRLSAGTTLRIKPVLIAVFRADGPHRPDGAPVYCIEITFVTDV